MFIWFLLQGQCFVTISVGSNKCLLFRVPTRTGKPVKMREHFPVRERSGNSEQTKKSQGKSYKILEKFENFRQMLFIIFKWYLNELYMHIITTRKRSLGQGNIFSSVCQEFCLQGGLPQCMLGCQPPWQGDTSLARRPPWQGRPPTPWQGDPPPSACWDLWSTSGQYASYWNGMQSCLLKCI